MNVDGRDQGIRSVLDGQELPQNITYPSVTPPDLAQELEEDPLSNLYDVVLANFVFDGFCRLGSSIYSESSLQHILNNLHVDVIDYGG